MRMIKNAGFGLFVMAALTGACSSSSAPPPGATFTMTQNDEDFVVSWELYNHMNQLTGGATWWGKAGPVSASGNCRPAGSYTVTGTIDGNLTDLTLQLSNCGGFLHDNVVSGGYVREILSYSGQVQLTFSNNEMELSSSALTVSGELQPSPGPLPLNATLGAISGYSGCAMSYDSAVSSGSICGRAFSAAAASAGATGAMGGSGGGMCSIPDACTQLTNTCAGNPESQAPCYCAAACVDQAGISNPSGCCMAGMEQSCVAQLESDCQMQQANALALGSPSCGYPCQ
jgi:hypothetical protein